MRGVRRALDMDRNQLDCNVADDRAEPLADGQIGNPKLRTTSYGNETYPTELRVVAVVGCRLVQNPPLFIFPPLN